MLVKIIGWIWLFWGVIFLIWPKFLMKKLQKQSFKKIKKLLFGIALFLGIILISAAFKSTGAASKVLAVLGIIAIIKAFLFLKSKASEKLTGWFTDKPVSFFRIWAAVHISIALFLIIK